MALVWCTQLFHVQSLIITNGSIMYLVECYDEEFNIISTLEYKNLEEAHKDAKLRRSLENLVGNKIEYAVSYETKEHKVFFFTDEERI